MTRKFQLNDRVRKTHGASWQGRVCGFYSTMLTPLGYAVESEREPGSVQIYPEAALEAVPSDVDSPTDALAKALQQQASLREALLWYARCDIAAKAVCEGTYCQMEHDDGERARKALNFAKEKE